MMAQDYGCAEAVTTSPSATCSWLQTLTPDQMQELWNADSMPHFAPGDYPLVMVIPLAES